MEVPFEIRRGYDLLEQGLVGDAQAYFEQFRYFLWCFCYFNVKVFRGSFMEQCFF